MVHTYVLITNKLGIVFIECSIHIYTHSIYGKQLIITLYGHTKLVSSSD